MLTVLQSCLVRKRKGSLRKSLLPEIRERMSLIPLLFRSALTIIIQPILQRMSSFVTCSTRDYRSEGISLPQSLSKRMIQKKVYFCLIDSSKERVRVVIALTNMGTVVKYAAPLILP